MVSLCCKLTLFVICVDVLELGFVPNHFRISTVAQRRPRSVVTGPLYSRELSRVEETTRINLISVGKLVGKGTLLPIYGRAVAATILGKKLPIVFQVLFNCQ